MTIAVRAAAAGSQGFGAFPDPEQHSPRHEESRRLDYIGEQPRPDRLCADAAARHESCWPPVNRVKPELPHPIEAAHVPHIQDERAAGFDDGNRPAWTATERNLVSYSEVLKTPGGCEWHSADQDSRTAGRASHSCTDLRADNRSAPARARCLPAARRC